MWHLFKAGAAVTAVVLSQLVTTSVLAQQTTAPEDSFASENAVLDTSILFAIGAREARQELRGAFGWPTFQEGLVDGVYFRFDPDGYARFAPTPRLDVDVFEVICRPRTHTCLGRKEGLQVTLNSRGQVLLQIENVTEADTFAISEGVTELPIPNAILQPLEPRLEILLASGGELISRRGENEIHRISLAGFGAIVPYLRWVAARQDYTVLPRGWPVPNTVSQPESTGLTQTPSWQSPMPQPHVVTQTFPPATAGSAGAPQVQTDVAEVRGELKVLRELLFDQQAGHTQASAAPPSVSPQGQDQLAQIANLQQMINSLHAELNRLQSGVPVVQAEIPAPTQTPSMAAQASSANLITQTDAPQSDAHQVARHLEYLMTELGLAPDVALMVVQQRNQNAPSSEPAPQETIINDILKELRAQIPQPRDSLASVSSDGEYKLLSEYFRSVSN